MIFVCVGLVVLVKDQREGEMITVERESYLFIYIMR